MTREPIEPKIEREHFRPFKIITTAGNSHDITAPNNLALGSTELFYYFPTTDRSIQIPYAHIATIYETAPAKGKK